MIISDYSALKISDITFIFKNAISGKYGEFYESLTIPKILSWFAEHFEQRCEIAETMSNQEHSSFTNASVVKWDSKVVEEMFKGISEEKIIEPKVSTIRLPDYLDNSDSYIEQLKEFSKQLSIKNINEIIEKWKNYRHHEMYIEVLQQELKNRESKNP